MMNPEGHLAKRKFDDEIVMLQQVASPNSSSESMVQASNIWPRNQVICMNDERLRRELGDDTTKQISSNFTTDNGQGPMKVFIINQPVRNVIRAGNNLIVETEPSNKINPPDFQQLTTTPHMDKNDEKELEI